MRIGCAGWHVSRSSIWRCFPPPAVTCIATRSDFNAVEINSSFYRPHRRATYERWAATAPDSTSRLRSRCRNKSRTSSASPRRRLRSIFFSIKQVGLAQNSVRSWSSCRQAWHSIALWRTRSLLRYGRAMRAKWSGEPRHATWFTATAHALRADLRIARAAADPPVDPGPFALLGGQGLHYYRLHGAPHIYYSEYDAAFLEGLAQTLSGADRGRAGASSTIRHAARRSRMRCRCNGSWRGFKPRRRF